MEIFFMVILEWCLREKTIAVYFNLPNPYIYLTSFPFFC